MDVGGEATLVTNVAGVLAVLLLDNVLEVVVDLQTVALTLRLHVMQINPHLLLPCTSIRESKSFFENSAYLATHLDGLLEGGGANGSNHELLHGKTVASVGASVDNVHPAARSLVLNSRTNV